MEKKEIILSKIAEILGRNGFIKKNNGEIKSRLKCIGLGEYFETYSKYLIPYTYNQSQGREFENARDEYNLYLGLDFIFDSLYKESKISEIIVLLKELTKSFNSGYIFEYMERDFVELKKLYMLFGLELTLEPENIKITSCMSSDEIRVKELFSVEKWLNSLHKDVFDSYDAAITSYTNGHFGSSIESCRTTIVSMFTKFRETEGFSKWLRGIYNVSGDSKIDNNDLAGLNKAIEKDLKKDLADFFKENEKGNLTKTKTIYMFYSMMSDYGTHRNENSIETPTQDDALFVLRLTDTILFWVYSRTNISE